MSRVLIRNVSVLVVPERGECRVDEAQDISVEDDRIVAITPTSGEPGAAAPAAHDRGSTLPGAGDAAGLGDGAGLGGRGGVGWGSGDGVEVLDGAGLLAVPGLV